MKTKKRIISLLLVQIIFSFLLINSAKCQEVDFEFTVDSILVENTYKKNIKIDITKGEKPFTIMLKQNNNEKPLKYEEEIDKLNLKFESLENGLYIIQLTDRRKLVRIKSVLLD